APKQIAAVDRLVLTGFDRGSAILEAQGLDVYSEGITDAAYIFVGVTYIELPVSMEFVGFRTVDRAPEGVLDDGSVFEFFETEICSDGGLVVVSDQGVSGGHEVLRPIGYIVAASCSPYEGRLPSGNRRR